MLGGPFNIWDARADLSRDGRLLAAGVVDSTGHGASHDEDRHYDQPPTPRTLLLAWSGLGGIDGWGGEGLLS